MSLNFKDHFSGHASSYAAFRPKSPPELFAYLIGLCAVRRLAWDVGTGNGQAAIELAPHFERVMATDASAEQIKHAVNHPKIVYRVGRAEESQLAHSEVDLITVGQAFHWFDFEKFFSEVRRVAKTDAVIALWTYDLATIDPGVDALVRDYYDVRVGKYWPPERKWVDEHYRTIPFPFTELKPPSFEMVEERTLAEWCGYLSTWSATQKAIKECGPSVFSDFADELKVRWGEPDERKRVRWPLYLRVGRVTK